MKGETSELLKKREHLTIINYNDETMKQLAEELMKKIQHYQKNSLLLLSKRSNMKKHLKEMSLKEGVKFEQKTASDGLLDKKENVNLNVWAKMISSLLIKSIRLDKRFERTLYKIIRNSIKQVEKKEQSLCIRHIIDEAKDEYRREEEDGYRDGIRVSEEKKENYLLLIEHLMEWEEEKNPVGHFLNGSRYPYCENAQEGGINYYPKLTSLDKREYCFVVNLLVVKEVNEFLRKNDKKKEQYILLDGEVDWYNEVLDEELLEQCKEKNIYLLFLSSPYTNQLQDGDDNSLVVETVN